MHCGRAGDRIMREVWLTAKYEIRTTLGRRSFWVTTLLLPIVVIILVFLPAALLGDEDSGLPGLGADQDPQPLGYVDTAALLEHEPKDLPLGIVRRYNNEASAKADLDGGLIDRYYLIPHDYVESGRLTVVQARYQPLRALDSAALVTYVLNTGITGNESTARLLLNPVAALHVHSLHPTSYTGTDNLGTSSLLPHLLMFVLYFALAMTSGFMLQSVSKEKENRTAEVLLSTIRPRDLMLGKIAGLWVVGLIQVAVWLTVILSIFLSKKGVFGMDLAISGRPTLRLIPWTIVYFLLGYMMYSSLYVMLGVLAPTARDATQFTFIAILPLVVPMLFLTALTERPNGTLSIVLSVLPPTSPVAMVARMASAPVPWPQPVAGAAGLALVGCAFVLLAGRLFGAANLLSTRALTWSRLGALLRLQPTSAVDARRRSQAGLHDATQAKDEVLLQTKGAVSSRNVLILGLFGLLMVAFGIRQYLRGDSLGPALALAGAAIAAGAYYRYQRNR